MLARVERALAGLDAGVGELEELRGLRRGRLTVGATQSLWYLVQLPNMPLPLCAEKRREQPDHEETKLSETRHVDELL